MEINLEEFKSESNENRKVISQAFKKIRKQKANVIDRLINQYHDEVFENTDCLTCANCCKTTSPVFKSKDIESIAKYLKIKPTQLVERYLHMDDEGDYVLKSSPCVFLNVDNTCSIYHVRPIACQGYPHTGRRKAHSLLELTEKNVSVCPAVLEIIKRIDNFLSPPSPLNDRIKVNRKSR